MWVACRIPHITCPLYPTTLGSEFLAGLLSLNVHANRLHRLPTGMASAALLTSLSVGSNQGLSLTRAEVDGLLARLPNLAHLDLYATGTPQDVAAYADRILRLRRN